MIVGLGQLGIPVAKYVKEIGFETYGYDVNPKARKVPPLPPYFRCRLGGRCIIPSDRSVLTSISAPSLKLARPIASWQTGVNM